MLTFFHDFRSVENCCPFFNGNIKNIFPGFFFCWLLLVWTPSSVGTFGPKGSRRVRLQLHFITIWTHTLCFNLDREESVSQSCCGPNADWEFVKSVETRFPAARPQLTALVSPVISSKQRLAQLVFQSIDWHTGVFLSVTVSRLVWTLRS